MRYLTINQIEITMRLGQVRSKTRKKAHSKLLIRHVMGSAKFCDQLKAAILHAEWLDCEARSGSRFGTHPP